MAYDAGPGLARVGSGRETSRWPFPGVSGRTEELDVDACVRACVCVCGVSLNVLSLCMNVGD